MDTLDGALRAAASHSPVAYPLAFAAGIATSAGPCTAPRYLAIAALVNAARHPMRVTGAFVTGLAGAYVVLGMAATALTMIWSGSRDLYAALAVILIASGTMTLWRDARHHGTQRTCAGDTLGGSPHGDPLTGRVSVGGTFLLGASSALVASPCCTPMIAALAGLTVSAGRMGEGALLLAFFGCGHAVPLLTAGALGARFSSFAMRTASAQAPRIVGGALLVALGGYYGLLA